MFIDNLMAMLRPQVTRQDVELAEGRVYARGLSSGYLAALMRETLGSKLSRIGSVGPATLEQRYRAAKRILGESE